SQPMKFGCKVMGPVPVVRGLGKAASCNCSGSKQHCGKGPGHATVCFPKRRRPGSCRPPSRNHSTPQQTHRIHGHMHDSCDFTVGTTRIIANPRGYGNENLAFARALVVEAEVS